MSFIVSKTCDAGTICDAGTSHQDPSIVIALQLSLYWEGDLRNLSYFLNKRKEFEFKTEILLTFNIW